MKDQNFRSKKILRWAEDAPHCMYCKEPNRGQVVACHFNAIKYGKGMGLKAHDIIAALCDKCHSLADGAIGPHLTKEQRELILYEGIYRTFLWALQEGKLVVK